MTKRLNLKMQKMKYKEIVFDFDGTIVDTVSTLFEWLKAGNVDLELPSLDDKNVERMRGMGPEELMTELGFSKVQLLKYVGKFLKYIRKNPELLKVIDGMPQVFDRLSGDYTLGVLSSNKLDVIEGVFEVNRIDAFEYIRAGAALWSKETKMRNLVRKRGLESNELLYIGDEIKDVEGARKAGIDIISVVWGYNNYKALEKVNPGMVVRKPEEIIRYLD